MPRKNPLPKLELEICRRVRAFRQNSLKWTQANLARELGTDAYSIAALEHGRRPLRYAHAYKLFDRFPLNPVWLATGRGEQSLKVHMPPPGCEPALNERALFSDAFARLKDDLLKGVAFAAESDAMFVEAETEFATGDPHARLHVLDSISGRIAEWLTRIPDASLNDFYRTLIKQGESIVRTFPQQSPFIISENDRKLQRDRIWLAHRVVELNPTKPEHEHVKVTTDDLISAFLGGKSSNVSVTHLRSKKPKRKKAS